MKKNNLIYLISFLFILCGFIGCSSDDNLLPGNIKVDTDVLTFNAFGSTKKILIESNYEWNARLKNDEDTLWCKLTKEQDSLHISTVINHDTIDHQSTIYIQSGIGNNKTTKEIPVFQEAGEKTYLQFSSNIIEMTQKGGNTQCEVLSNNTISLKWENDEEIDWVNYTFKDDVLDFTFEENLNDDPRFANLIVTSEGGKNISVKDTIEVSQMGASSYIGVNLKDIELDYNDTKLYTLKVTSNIEYKVYSSGGNFITVNPTEKDTYTIKFNEVNYTTSNITADVYVDALDETLGSDINKTITFTQKAAPTAEIATSDELVVLSGTLEKHLGISCSMKQWEISMVDEKGNGINWLTITSDFDLKELGLKCKEASNEQRTAIVTLSCGDKTNGAKTSFKVIQTSAAPYFIFKNEKVILSGDGNEISVGIETNQTSWEIQPTSWVKVVKGSDNKSIKISASALDAGSRAETITIKYGTNQAKLVVEQMKPYKTGDIYTINGKKLGIVYEVSDNGLHGKVFSFNAYNKMDLVWGVGLTDLFDYSQWPTVVEADPAISTSATSGKENMKSIKAVSNWKTTYPMAAWVDNLNDSNGEPGWYFPAINEVKSMVMFINGDKDSNGNLIFSECNVTASSKERRTQINETILNNNGEKFYFSSDDVERGDKEHENAYYVFSSTERDANEDNLNYAHVYNIYLGWNYIQTDGNRTGKNAAGSVRPILEF